MKNSMKRLLAIVLAMVMVIGIGYYSMDGRLRASDEDANGSAASQQTVTQVHEIQVTRPESSSSSEKQESAEPAARDVETPSSESSPSSEDDDDEPADTLVNPDTGAKDDAAEDDGEKIVLNNGSDVVYEDKSGNKSEETTPEETIPEEPILEENGLIIDRKEQTSEVNTDKGDPDKTPNSAADMKLPEGYELLLGDDGVFRVTYTIPEGTDVENITLDLNKAMQFAQQYAGATDSTWVEPGDSRVVEFYIKSESGHTYKYADGSFVLTTANLGTNQSTDAEGNTTVTEPNEGDVVGFDGQVLDKDHTGTDKIKISMHSESIEKLLVAQGILTQEDADHNYRTSISYDEYCKLKNYLKETYGTDDVTEGLKQYLMEYYSEKDGKEYTDFAEMLSSSAAASSDLITGTGANTPIRYEGKDINNYVIANDLSSVPLNGLNCQTTLINESLGTNYEPPKSAQNFTNTQIARELAGTSSITLQQIIDMVNGQIEKKLTSAEKKNLSSIKAALTSRGEDKLAAAVYNTTYTSESYRVTSYIRLYNIVKGEDYRDAFIRNKGLDTVITGKSDSTSASATTVSVANGATALKKYIDANEKLTDDEKTAIKAAIGTSTSTTTSTWTPLFLKLYDVLHKDTGAYQDYITKNGYSSDSIEIANVSGNYSSSTKAIVLKPESTYSTVSIDPAARYNTFYNALLSVVYSKDKEGIDKVTGGESGIVQTATKNTYKAFDADDKQWYTGLVPFNELDPDAADSYNYYYGLPLDALVDPVAYASGKLVIPTVDGKPATPANAEVDQTYVSAEPEYNNDSWGRDKLAPQLADYMNMDNQAWQDANAMFNELLGQGIDAQSAAVHAYIAYNLDGEGTGNDYQDTQWSWHNTIDLERIDGELNVVKVDEAQNPITSDEAEFKIWKLNQKVEEDGSVTNEYFYLTESTTEAPARDEHGNVMRDDEGQPIMETQYVYTFSPDPASVSTHGGKLHVDYAMLENVIYYLQEVSAPEGYTANDSTVYVITDEETWNTLENDPDYASVYLPASDTVQYAWAGGAIDSEKPLNLYFVNEKEITPPNPDGPRPDHPTPQGSVTIGDYNIPLGGNINMNEGDCFD